MSSDKKQQLEQKPFDKKQPNEGKSDKSAMLRVAIWSIADTLRGKMDADDFRDYILGFIFYKPQREDAYICRCYPQTGQAQVYRPGTPQAKESVPGLYKGRGTRQDFYLRMPETL